MPTFLTGLIAQPKVTAAPSGCQFCWFGFSAACPNTAAEATKPVNATQMMRIPVSIASPGGSVRRDR
jgi:hypothetical protein